MPKVRSHTLPAFSFSGLVHAFCERHGGCSPRPYGSLNVGRQVGDRAGNVRENRARIKKAHGLECLVSGKQVHGENILVVRERPEADMEADGYDAFLTNIPGVGLMVQQADCQAVLLYDAREKAVANIHAGWRGSVNKIIKKTIGQMRLAYGSRPGDIRAAISPALGPCCAEFVGYETELPPEFYSYQVRPNYFDFWAISRDQLRASGVPLQNIFLAGICTKCSPNYFSHRREGVTGRCASVIALKAQG